MALAVTITTIENGQTTESVYGTIVASGSYALGGDTFNVSGLDQIKSSSIPVQVYLQSQKAAGNSGWLYAYRPGTTLANGFVQVFGTGASAGATHQELAAGAYPASITGDTIVFCAIFTRI